MTATAFMGAGKTGVISKEEASVFLFYRDFIYLYEAGIRIINCLVKPYIYRMPLFKTLRRFVKVPALFLFLFQNYIAKSQTNPVFIGKDTIAFSLERVAGLGPNGNSSIGIASYEALKNTEEIKAYPVMKNPPANLTNVIQYLFIVDQFQFFYQNHVSGIYSKAFFLEKANSMHWNLADTVNLSKKPIKSAFAVLAGIDSTKKGVVIVDANNNNDYADDIIKPLFKNVYSEGMMVKNAVSVQIDYFSRGAVRQDNIRVFLQRDHNPEKLALSFTFPEFNYTRFVYKGMPYFLCAEKSVLGQNFICVLPERPRFMSIDRGDLVTLNYFATIGGDKFKLIASNFAGRTVLLQGLQDGFSKTQAQVAGMEKAVANPTADTIVSDQVGFKAPLIQGKNMNPLMKQGGQVSTAGFKGKYIFVDFWSTYCAPCIQELPYLKAAYDKYKRDVFEIVGVFDEREPGLTKKIFAANKVTWPTISMNAKGSDISGYGHVQSFPTNYLIDPSGKIIAFNLRGEDLMNRLEELIGH